MLKELTKSEIYSMTNFERKELYIDLLRSINREGVERVISYLDTTDFYDAPASTKFHGNFSGGL